MTSTVAVTPAEKRAEPRRRVVKRAKLAFGGFVFVRECTVRDTSPTGFRVSVTGAHEIPDEFYLVLTAERVMQQVRVKWRRGNDLGVESLSEPQNLVGNADPRLRQFQFT